jgi:hypothetical protein
VVDLADFANLSQVQDDGIDVNILHPSTGEELGIVIRVAGPDSARQKKAQYAVNNERLRMSRNKRPTAAELEADARRITAAAIISWEGVVENGNPVELTKDSAVDLLTRYPFIYEQLAAAAGDRAGFIKS